MPKRLVSAEVSVSLLLGDGCCQGSVRLIAPPLAGNTLGSPNDSFVIAEWRYPGGLAGPPRLIAPRHVHHNDDEAWYVLEGTLCVQVGDKDIEARAGSGVLVPRGTPHTYWNPGPARYLLIMTPNIFRLSQGIHALKGADLRLPSATVSPARFGAPLRYGALLFPKLSPKRRRCATG